MDENVTREFLFRVIDSTVDELAQGAVSRDDVKVRIRQRAQGITYDDFGTPVGLELGKRKGDGTEDKVKKRSKKGDANGEETGKKRKSRGYLNHHSQFVAYGFQMYKQLSEKPELKSGQIISLLAAYKKTIPEDVFTDFTSHYEAVRASINDPERETPAKKGEGAELMLQQDAEEGLDGHAAFDSFAEWVAENAHKYATPANGTADAGAEAGNGDTAAKEPVSEKPKKSEKDKAKAPKQDKTKSGKEKAGKGEKEKKDGKKAEKSKADKQLAVTTPTSKVKGKNKTQKLTRKQQAQEEERTKEAAKRIYRKQQQESDASNVDEDDDSGSEEEPAEEPKGGKKKWQKAPPKPVLNETDDSSSSEEGSDESEEGSDDD